jgi:hypothetical protein
MTKIDCVIDSILAIDINKIDINSLFNKELTQLNFSISTGVIEWTLFQIIHLSYINSKLTKMLDHNYSLVLSWNLNGCKDKILLKFCLVCYHISNLNPFFAEQTLEFF